jgi:hypothetical protein
MLSTDLCGSDGSVTGRAVVCDGHGKIEDNIVGASV